MWKFGVFCAVITFILWHSIDASFSSRGEYEGPEDAFFKQAWGVISAGYPRILKEIIDIFNMNDRERMAFRASLEARTAHKMRLSKVSPQCEECVDNVGLMQAIIDLGLGFDELRDPAVDICFGLVEGQYHPDLLCPGMVDVFGPHVVDILNTTNKDAEEICLIQDDCTPDDINPIYRGKYDHYAKPIPKGRLFTASVVPSNRKLKNAMKVLHITDIHVDPDYKEGGVTQCGMPNCCRELYNNGTGYAGMWGNWNCNCPERTIELFLEKFSQMNPDMIMYTGDSPPHFVWLETQEYQLARSRYVAEEISKYFPGIPAFTTVGNHETFPTNLYYVGRPEIREFNEEVTKYWTDLSGFSAEQKATFRAGNYFSKLVQPGLRLISYNTNYGAGGNFYNILLIDEAEIEIMNQFLSDSLQTARQNGEKVIMLGHHMSGLSFQNRFMDELISQNGDIIILHLFGHSHSDNFRLLTDADTGEVYNVKISMGAMTSYGNTNPSGRMIYLDPDTFIPLEAETYYLDMDNIDEESPEIVLSYRHSEDYGMSDLLPASWGAFVDRMFNDTELFGRYRYNYETRTGLEGDCDDTCRRHNLCGLRYSNSEAVSRCREQL